MSHVAVVGNLARDRVDGGPPQPGGCPFFAAYALRAIDGAGHILTRCADADRPLFEGPVAALGVPVTILPAEHTSGFDHAYAGEIRSTTVTEIGDSWTPGDAAHLGPGVARGSTSLRCSGAISLRTRSPRSRRKAAACRSTHRGSCGLPASGRSCRTRASTHGCSTRSRCSSSPRRRQRSSPAGGSTRRALGRSAWPRSSSRSARTARTSGSTASLTHVPTTPVLGVETTGAGDAFMVAYVSARRGRRASGGRRASRERPGRRRCWRRASASS